MKRDSATSLRTFVDLEVRLEGLDRLVQLPLPPCHALDVRLDKRVLQELHGGGSVREVPQALEHKVLERGRDPFQDLRGENAPGFGCRATGLLGVDG